MAYAATPAAHPLAEAPAPAEEGKAPPTIDSHGGKLTPITCFGCGPDGVTSLLLMLALLSTLAPRLLKISGRVIGLPLTRLFPGLFLLALVGWNLLPSFATYVDPSAHAYALSVGERLWPLVGSLLLMIIGDALTPPEDRSRWRSLAGLAATSFGLVVMAFVVQTPNVGFGEPRDLSFALGCLIGLPVSLPIIWFWRRYNGPLFSVLLVAFGIAGFLLMGMLSPFGTGMAWLGLETSAFTMAAAAGAALRGSGAPGWQGLTGRAAWAYGWALRAFTVVIASNSLL